MILIAAATVHEIVRRRFVFAALLTTLVAAILAGWGFGSLAHLHGYGGKPLTALEVKAVTAVLVEFAAFTFSFILACAATLLASPMLSGEVESGILLPVLARRISRTHVVVGKALGLAIVLGAYGGFVGVLEAGVVWLTTGYVPPHPLAAIGALWLLAVVVVALTLALAARLAAIASSIVTIVCFGVAWMVGAVAALGAPYHNETLIRVGVVSQLLLPSDAMWRVAAYQLQPVAFAHGGPLGAVIPFNVSAPPPLAMIWWSLLWIVAIVLIAARSFERRDI